MVTTRDITRKRNQRRPRRLTVSRRRVKWGLAERVVSSFNTADNRLTDVAVSATAGMPTFRSRFGRVIDTTSCAGPWYHHEHSHRRRTQRRIGIELSREDQPLYLRISPKRTAWRNMRITFFINGRESFYSQRKENS